MAAKKKSAKRARKVKSDDGMIGLTPDMPTRDAKAVRRAAKGIKGKRKSKGSSASAIDRAFKMGRALGRLEGAAG